MKLLKPYFGAHGAGEIPVLIPNTEVKLSSGDYTATSGKLARCRIIKRPSEQGGLFLWTKSNCILRLWLKYIKNDRSRRDGRFLVRIEIWIQTGAYL